MRKRIVSIAVFLTILVSFAGLSAGADNDMTIDTLGATPFMYENRSYLPLRSVTSFLGAQLLWDAVKGQAVITHQGKELALTPGSRNALFDGQPVVFSATPMIGDGRMFVPVDVFRQTYGVPLMWDQAKSELRIKGPSGWGVVTVSRRPPPGWVRGLKTGWQKHGDATAPPGMSNKPGSHSVSVVPKATVKPQKTEKASVMPKATVTPQKTGKEKDVDSRATPTPPGKK